MNRLMVVWLLGLATIAFIIYVTLIQIATQQQSQDISMWKAAQSTMDKLPPVMTWVDTTTYTNNSQPYDYGNNLNYTSNSLVNGNESGSHPLLDFYSEPILTMFTTFRNSETERYIYENTIRNWQLLSPDVIPILFTEVEQSDRKGIAHFAVQHGWQVLPVPKTSSMGIPILRHMFLEAQKTFNTKFYCYANGDILFDRNLTDTIRYLQTSAHGGHIDKLLMVGRRSNWSIAKGVMLTELAQVGHYAKNSSLFISEAQDYFLTTRDGYPWTTIPDFVVGRVGYDNWLVVTALTKKIPVVDATETVTALHQTGTDGEFAGFRAMSEKHINHELAKGFDYSLGHVTCGHFATQRKNGKITITERELNGKKCNQRNVTFVNNPFTWKFCDTFRNIPITHRNTCLKDCNFKTGRQTYNIGCYNDGERHPGCGCHRNCDGPESDWTRWKLEWNQMEFSGDLWIPRTNVQ